VLSLPALSGRDRAGRGARVAGVYGRRAAGLTGGAYFRSWMRLTDPTLSMDGSAERIQSYKIVTNFPVTHI